MKKVLQFAVFFMAAITNYNCISGIMKNEMKQTPGEYRLLVHENPKAGDYSVYKSVSGGGLELTYYQQIEKADNGEILIKKGHIEASGLISAFKDVL